jgi:hypothetical protein
LSSKKLCTAQALTDLDICISWDNYLSKDYLEIVRDCLKCGVWGPAVIYCASALEAHLLDALGYYTGTTTANLLKDARNRKAISQIQSAQIDDIVTLRDAHAHPSTWLYSKSLKKLKSVPRNYKSRQLTPSWFRALKPNVKSASSIVKLYDKDLALKVTKTTIDLIMDITD